MFTFPIEAVRRVIARGNQDAAANGGFRIRYHSTKTGEGEQSGFWLVGDQGVYIMSNGKLAEGQKPLVVYSTECHPRGDPDWWDYKRRYFGRDDGVEFIDAGVAWHLNARMRRFCPGWALNRENLDSSILKLTAFAQKLAARRLELSCFRQRQRI